MVSLGSLGRDRPPADVTFDWFGTEIRCHPDVSDMAIVEFMAVAGKVDAESPEAMSAVVEFLRECIHPDDFDAYWSIGKAHRQGIEDHMRVVMALMDVVAGGEERPTGPSSESVPGATESADGSTGSLLERAFPGRPDLQAGVGQELIQKLRAV